MTLLDKFKHEVTNRKTNHMQSSISTAAASKPLHQKDQIEATPAIALQSIKVDDADQ